ncbi:ATP-dependent helicase [bacterium]|nr:ATP-dependent helicase [bacterium]
MADKPDIKKLFIAATHALSEEQFHIFHTIDMNVKGLIAAVACAGAGKTRLLSYLVCLAMLRVRQGQNLFLLTATRAAKSAALARVEKLTEELDLGLLFPPHNVRTFHSMALAHARSKHKGVDLVGKTRICELLAEIVEAEVNDPDSSKDSKELCRVLSPEDAATVLFNLRSEQLKGMLPIDGRVYGTIAKAALDKLVAAMAKDEETGKKLADFDSLICEYAVDLQCPGEPGDIIFVDESQDLTETQSKIVQTALARGITVVLLGDDSQGIFVFSGASFNTIHSLVNWTQTNNIDLQPFKLLKNHRSTNSIVAASELILPKEDRDFRVGVVGNGKTGVAVQVGADGSLVVPEILNLIKGGTSPPGDIVVLRHKNWSQDDTIVAQLRDKGVPLHVIGQNAIVSLSERVLAIVQTCMGIEDYYDELEDKMRVVQTFLRSIRGAHGCPVLVSKAIETVLEREGCDVDVLFLRKQSQVVCEFEKLIKAEKDAQDSRPAKKKTKTEDPSRKITNLKASLKAAAVVIGGFRRNVERVEKSEAPRMIQPTTTGTAAIQGVWEPAHLTGSKLTAKLVWCLVRDVLSVRVVNATAVRNEIKDIVGTMSVDIVNDYAIDISPVISKKLHDLHDTSTEGRVIFSTIHKFKGSERPTCFVTDMKAPWFKPDQCKLAALACFHNDKCTNIAGVGRCSCPRFLEKKAQQKRAVEAEAMRLMYVAASRAKERLYMSSADKTHPHPALVAMEEEGVVEKWE